MAFKKGHVAWNKGKRHSEETIKKLVLAATGRPSNARRNRVIKSCVICGKEIKTVKSLENAYVCCSKSCSKIRRQRIFSGTINPRWRGGITPLVKVIRHCFEYRQWRSDVFTRDEFVCVWCGAKGYLEADHIKPFAAIMIENNILTLEAALNCAELWDINNGRTLCKPCHNTTKGWKSR